MLLANFIAFNLLIHRHIEINQPIQTQRFRYYFYGDVLGVFLIGPIYDFVL
jgi:hypothetical protein